MQLTNALVVLSAALTGVSAHPSAHGHQRFHERRSVDAVEERDITFIKNKAPEPTPTSATPTATPSPANAPTGEYVPFCNGEKTAYKRATLAQIAYSGNTGTEDDWGCNMQIIDQSIKPLYNYTTTFTASDSDYTCSCFNKIGPKGLIDGCWFAAVTFTVKEGQSKDLAFDTDSQGSCACGPGKEVPKTFIGQFAGTWLEFDWGSVANGGNSGADASVLVAGAQSLPYYGMKVVANDKTCSWVKSDGSNEEAYMPGMEALDGVGCKGYYTGHLDVTLGDNFST